MGNLLITMIGIVFCALLMVAGMTVLQPTAYIEHNEANTNSAQISTLMADYNNLLVVTGHRPTAADYAAIYPNGSANAAYTNAGGTITVNSQMDAAATNGNGKAQAPDSWTYMPGCGVAGGPQDCFCLTVNNPSNVVYKATQVSAIQQMESAAQSRVEYNTDQCANAATATLNPTAWQQPANGLPYYLTVRLNAASNVAAVNGACGLLADTCTAGTQTGYNAGAGTWSCTGSNGGTTASCSYTAPTAVNGVCGSTAGTCTAGTQTGYNAGAGTWSCTGSNGGTTVPCSYTVPSAVSGACGSSAGTCSAGTSASYNAASGTWTCNGINGGSNTPCTAAITGACSTIAGTCTIGTPASYNAASGTWTCNGINGGSNTPCTAAITGACNTTTADMCTVGTPASYNSSSGTWTCTGVNGGTSAACTIAINGVCSTTANTCTVGTASSYDSSTGTWTCNGLNNGSNASCTSPPTGASFAVVSTIGCCLPACGASTQTITYSCTQGGVTVDPSLCTANGVTVPANTTQACTDYSECVPVNGACGTTGYQSCSPGTAYNAVPNADVYGNTSPGYGGTWYCAGSNGGSNSQQCSVTNGVCGGNGVGNNLSLLCYSGTLQNDYYETQGASWTCQGSGVGATNASCQGSFYIDNCSSACAGEGYCSNPVCHCYSNATGENADGNPNCPQIDMTPGSYYYQAACSNQNCTGGN